MDVICQCDRPQKAYQSQTVRLKMKNAMEIVKMRGHKDRQRQPRGRMESQDELQ